ncbi:MAG: DUF3459 domain-containing protein [Elusimicrobia bacterium]|nr:DUF3459 domain-containing protein [Elusimicrobiota bacterium]
MHALLNRQLYRLAHWRVASDEINYRRFFNINELAAVRVEDEMVFQFSHRLIFRLIAEGRVQGLRIDHPDGLYDPPLYFGRLQDGALRQALAREMGSDQGIDEVLREREFARSRPLFIVAEKVLDRGERLPDHWRIHGTVGYDALNDLNGVLVDRSNERAMTRVYEDFIGHKIDFERLIHVAKRRVERASMASEIESLGARLDHISEKSPHFRDFTRPSLIAALREIIHCFPVYRTYIAPRDPEASEKDARYSGIAVERALARFLDGMISGASPSPAARSANPFLEMFLPFQDRISRLGKLNSLAMLVLKLGLPGVADTYQGNELWDYSLVDPDNRRPVDLRYFGPQGDDRLLLLNLGADISEASSAEPLLASPKGRRWSLLWSSEDVRYGGQGTPPWRESGFFLGGACAIALKALVHP